MYFLVKYRNWDWDLGIYSVLGNNSIGKCWRIELNDHESNESEGMRNE